MSSLAPSGIRIPPDLREWLKRAAEANRRSMSSEVVVRLEQSRRLEEASKQGAAQ